MLSRGIGTMATSATMAAARSLSITHKPKWIFTPLSFSSSPSNSNSKPRKLVLYSKPGCCLCDGLKEKLNAAFSLSSPDSLHDVVLQVRDITSNPEWEKAYQYEIPVLAKVLSDDTEEILPRLSPRLGVELVHKKIAAAFKQENKMRKIVQEIKSSSHRHLCLGLYITSTVTLIHGMNSYVLVVYRNAIAALVLAPFTLVLESIIVIAIGLYCVAWGKSKGFSSQSVDLNQLQELPVKVTTILKKV